MVPKEAKLFTAICIVLFEGSLILAILSPFWISCAKVPADLAYFPWPDVTVEIFEISEPIGIRFICNLYPVFSSEKFSFRLIKDPTNVFFMWRSLKNFFLIKSKFIVVKEFLCGSWVIPNIIDFDFFVSFIIGLYFFFYLLVYAKRLCDL